MAQPLMCQRPRKMMGGQGELVGTVTVLHLLSIKGMTVRD